MSAKKCKNKSNINLEMPSRNIDFTIHDELNDKDFENVFSKTFSLK
jgi:hypothetical protein